MKIKAAIMNLYNNETNQEMRCMPDNDYNIYISSGGPSDLFDGK